MYVKFRQVTCSHITKMHAKKPIANSKDRSIVLVIWLKFENFHTFKCMGGLVNTKQFCCMLKLWVKIIFDDNSLINFLISSCFTTTLFI